MKQHSPAFINREPSQVQADDRLNRAIGLSIAAHVAILLFFVVRGVIYPSEPLILENAIRVDMVALPDKQAQLPPVAEPVPEAKAPPQPEAPPAPEPAKPEAAKPELPKPQAAPPKPETPKVDLNKRKQDQDAALRRLEALQKIEQMSKSATAQTSKPAASAPQPIKGSEISKGNSLTGVTRLEHQGYLQSVDSAIKSQWSIPGWMKNSELGARVRIFIDENGNVIRRQITKSSNNEVFDSRALAAVDAAVPLPRPPDSLTSILSIDGIELGFGSE